LDHCACGSSGAAAHGILADLDAFLQERRRCGDRHGYDRDGGVEDGRVWTTCECGAGLYHWLAPPLDGRWAPRAGAARIPGGPRQQRLTGTWKPTGVLLEAGEAIAATAQKLPYLDGC
jgi:hypothetical protein